MHCRCKHPSAEHSSSPVCEMQHQLLLTCRVVVSWLDVILPDRNVCTASAHMSVWFSAGLTTIWLAKVYTHLDLIL